MKPKIYLYGTSGQYGNYLAALTEAGAEPVLSRDLFRACGCDGLLLPGGGDIGVTLEATDSFLIRSFADSGRPILGICRGMQALNVFFGGTLHARIPGHQQVQGDLIHPTRARGLLSQLLGPAPLVTSNHHQAVRVLGRSCAFCNRRPTAPSRVSAMRRCPFWACNGTRSARAAPACGRMRWMPGRCCGILWANAVANLRRDWYTVRKGGG
ncbi:MAG: gamma-glutamyl-gamma-aminobutyrate hydrolase family protein [Vescimonas sp.]